MSALRALTALAVLVAPLASGCLAFHPDRLPGVPEEATFADLGDTLVHYEDLAPEGAELRGAVVLVHGFGASTTEWRLVVPALRAAGFRTVAMDLRGHGWSTRPDGDYSIAAQAALVVELLDHLGVERFALVGHSWGSAVSLAVAAMAPTRVTRLALYNGMYFDDQQPVLFSWARVPGLGELIYGAIYPERQEDKLAFAFFDPEAHISQEQLDVLDDMMDRPGTLAAALAGVRAMEFEGLEALYPTIEQEVLLLWGREDRVTPLEYGERLANTLPHARLHVVPRCGHVPMLEVPVATTHALVRFMTGGERERAQLDL